MTIDDVVPTLGAGVKFRFDATRQAWILLAPERLFLPDEHAVEILRLIDGERAIAEITSCLAAKFDAPQDMIAADVRTLLQDLADKGAVRL